MQTHYTHEAPKQASALPAALANINTKVLDDGTLKKLGQVRDLLDNLVVLASFEVCLARPVRASYS
jgi:hypothetical protein